MLAARIAFFAASALVMGVAAVKLSSLMFS